MRKAPQAGPIKPLATPGMAEGGTFSLRCGQLSISAQVRQHLSSCKGVLEPHLLVPSSSNEAGAATPDFGEVSCLGFYCFEQETEHRAEFFSPMSPPVRASNAPCRLSWTVQWGDSLLCVFR